MGSIFKNDYDAIFQDDIVDGCGYEIISLKALQDSHSNGQENIGQNIVHYTLEKINIF